MANRYGYMPNVNHIIGPNGRTIPVDSNNPLSIAGAGEGGAVGVGPASPLGVFPVAQLNTLLDGKTLNRQYNELWEQAGTGTPTFQTNKLNMAVASGEWYVYQTRRFYPYFSGKPQKVEMTFDKFAPEANVTKRVGYFSSNTASPYDSTYDGFYLESGNGTIRFVLKNAGTTIYDVDITNWAFYDNIEDYQNLSEWDNFTVIEFNFLWLGGAYLEMKIVTQSGFTTAHSLIHAGTSQDVFLASPNQPARYEIRSTTGTGSFRAICSQIATSGSVAESSYSKSINTGSTALNFAAIGTTYALLGVRKQASLRTNPVRIINADIHVSSSDTVLWTLQINPTLSAGLTYGAFPNSAFEYAPGTGAITVTGAGIVIACGYLVQNDSIQAGLFNDNYLSWFSGSLSGTQDQYVLCITPISVNVNAFGAMTLFEG